MNKEKLFQGKMIQDRHVHLTIISQTKYRIPIHYSNVSKKETEQEKLNIDKRTMKMRIKSDDSCTP